jgi:molybdate transport system substrate-binding protein
MTLKILSGGAANGLVNACTADFTSATGHDICGDYGAVGAMRDRITGGEQVDLIILTRKIIDDLAHAGMVRPDSVTDLGNVVTGVGVREGSEVPDVSTADGLRAALAGASSLYVPDTQRATAGIHVAGVIARLGLEAEMADRLRTFPNGQTAMATMVADAQDGAIGCTQVTEILNTPGVVYAGDLPEAFALSTVYTAAVARDAEQPEAASTLIRLLSDPGAADLRRRVGFT